MLEDKLNIDEISGDAVLTEPRFSGYDMADFWLETVAPKYFDMNDTSLNRAGLFGYINEILSHSLESLLNENTILFNEQFFKRAKLPQTIYSNASHYGVTDLGARPARMKFALTINEETLLKKTIHNNNANYFIIDSMSEIIVENEFIYSLDYDIKISVSKNNNGKYVYSARYVTDELDNPVSPIKTHSNPYLKLASLTQNRSKYIVLYVEASQCNKIIKNKVIYSDDFIDYFSFDVDYDSSMGQLADFSVYYREPTSTEFKQIEKRTMDSAATEKPFCFYQRKDLNKINISFSTIMRFFRPKINSELKIVFYNTEGAHGNYQYLGDNCKIHLKSEKFDYRDTIIMVKSLSDSVNGRDVKTFEEIKNETAILACTANNISTERDLNNYFAVQENFADVLFVKKRDDILDRRFSSFLMLRDGENNIIPSNTLGMDLSDDDFDLVEESTKRYILKAGREFIYKPDSRELKRFYRGKTLLSNPKFSFMNPFTIIVNKQPFFVSYFCNSISKNFTPEFHEVNDEASVNFIINNILMKRNAIEEDYYDITFNTVPNIDQLDYEFANLDKDEKFVSDNHKMKVKGVLYDADGTLAHYFDCEMIDYNNNDKRAYFSAKIKTDDYISVYSFLRTTGNLYDLKNPEIEQPLIPATDLRFGFICYIQDEIANCDQRSRYHQKIPGTNDYTVVNVYNIDEGVQFINNFDKMMYSDIKFRMDDNGNFNYIIDEVPVIKHEYLSIKKYSDQFFNVFMTNFTVLGSYLNRLTNAFNLSVKLFNTYGKAYYYYINKKTTNLLDQINLKLYLSIKLNPNKIMDSILKEEIRMFILRYIETVATTENMNFYYSNLITNLEQHFDPDIRWTEIHRMNGYDASVQSVEKNFPILDSFNNNNLLDFVPEYLNINKTFSKDKVMYDVIVEFV